MENKKKYNRLDIINPNRTVPENIINISTKQREISQNNERKKKKINKANLLKRRLIFIATTISLGAVSANLIDAATKYFEEQKIISKALDEYAPIVQENTNILKDEKGKPIHKGKDVVFWIDTNNIGNWVEEKLKEGANEEAVVYGIYHNLPANEKENNFYDILEAANLPVDWAEENGYTGMDDKILEDTVNQEYINAYYNTNTNEKNIGGR